MDGRWLHVSVNNIEASLVFIRQDTDSNDLKVVTHMKDNVCKVLSDTSDSCSVVGEREGDENEMKNEMSARRE